MTRETRLHWYCVCSQKTRSDVGLLSAEASILRLHTRMIFLNWRFFSQPEAEHGNSPLISACSEVVTTLETVPRSSKSRV
jgi:hypothetical protein